MVRHVFLLFLFIIVVFNRVEAQPQKVHDEIVYHVFQRSFFDSNNDDHGDLNGLKLKLKYLQQLGVTSILLTPIWQSAFYHNYFSDDFEKIDPKYGSMADYIALVKEIHKRGMKVYLDMESQYVTEDHLWWKDSFGNPKSKYSGYIIYNDKEQRQPESIVANYTELKGYNGVVKKLTTVNLKNPEVKKYNYELFKFWLDPDLDGNLADGADGFRLDHLMDNLDHKGKLTNLLADFWRPLIDTIKSINPEARFIAEPGDWKSFGRKFYTIADVDNVLAIRLAFAFRSLNKQKIIREADSTFNVIPPGKQPLIFIENHDIPRFATAVNQDMQKERIGAALNLLIGGMPSIYYGQEIGMLGKSGNYGPTDANELSDREAFKWYKANAGKGMAFWYKNSGPWWDHRYNQPNDGISLEEQQHNSNSLWSFYHSLIKLRKKYPALITGTYQNVENDNKYVFSFLRSTPQQRMLIIINLSDQEQQLSPHSEIKGKRVNRVWGSAPVLIDEQRLSLKLPAYGLQIYELK